MGDDLRYGRGYDPDGSDFGKGESLQGGFLSRQEHVAASTFCQWHRGGGQSADTLTKRCPHLGCALKWNAVVRSWDCPCHGSRFGEDGGLIDNPANGDWHPS